jgi:hypothetical protein
MLFRRYLMGALFEGVGSGGAGEGTGGTPTAPAPAPAVPFAVFHNAESLNERLSRAQRSHLKDQFGTDDAEVIKARLKKAEELEAAEKERERKDMSELQKTQSDLTAEKAAKAKVEEELNKVRFERHVAGLCAELQIPNVDYALYVVAQAAEKTADGAQLDAKAHLQGLLEKPQFKAAFGIQEQPTVVPQPVNTSPTPTTPAPAPVPANGHQPPAADAFSMNKQQFQQHLTKLGVS